MYISVNATVSETTGSQDNPGSEDGSQYINGKKTSTCQNKELSVKFAPSLEWT